MQRFVLALVVVATAESLTACSSGGETKTAAAPPVTSVPSPPKTSLPPPPPPRTDLSQRSVYFDFDHSEIKPEGWPVVDNWAGYLLAHPTARVRLEGNCDERGTREYNIGLGERRAGALAHALEAKGVAEAQLDVISYGKEHPVAFGHDEASWAKNRRADLVEK